MEHHYIGGYYLIKPKPIDFGDDLSKIVWTCSGCINSLAFDGWALSWMGEKPDKKVKRDLQITNEKITQIQQWTDNKFEDGINGFPDLKMAEEFKTLFFESSNNLFYLSINFPETDANLLIDDFAAGNNTQTFNYNNGNFDLRKNLLKKKFEIEDATEEFLGYDLIGVECDGSFHSFYCSNITKTITDKFTLQCNSFGLFDKIENPNEIRQFLNDPQSLLEPIPYYIVKVKRVRSASS